MPRPVSGIPRHPGILGAGLALYVYDPTLSAMGQAHADYLLANETEKMTVEVWGA